MKYIRQFESWRSNNKIELLLETVVNIDEDIVNVLKSFENHPKEGFKLISKYVLDALNSGKDYPKNKYDQIGKFTEDPSMLQVKMGKQLNNLKIAKVIRTLLVSIGVEVGKDPIKDDTIQKFADDLVGRLKSESSESVKGEFKLVSGSDILKYYDSNNSIVKKGSELNNSCMAGSVKNDQMEIYKLNPDKIQLLVKLIDGKVDARSLVWKLDYSSDGNDYFLDRCYCNDNSDKELMFKEVKKMLGDKVSRFEISDKPYYEAETKSTEIVKLNKVLTKFYPYIDSFFNLIVKRDGDNLVDVGIVTTNGGLLTDGKEHIEKLGPEYKWLLNDDTCVHFTCRSTTGERTVKDPEKSQFNNDAKKLYVKGYKVEIEKGKPLSEFRNVIRIFDKLASTQDPNTIFDMEVTNDVDGMVELGSFYFKPEECEKDIKGLDKPYVILVKVFNVEKLYNDKGLMIKTKLGEKSFKDLFELISKNSPQFSGENDFMDFNGGFGKMLTELDCYILGIQDKVDNSKKGETWGYIESMRVSDNKITNSLERLFGNNEYTEMRKKMVEVSSGYEELTKNEWLKVKAQLSNKD